MRKNQKTSNEIYKKWIYGLGGLEVTRDQNEGI